jgi:hypothetical protein
LRHKASVAKLLDGPIRGLWAEIAVGGASASIRQYSEKTGMRMTGFGRLAVVESLLPSGRSEGRIEYVAQHGSIENFRGRPSKLIQDRAVFA